MPVHSTRWVRPAAAVFHSPQASVTSFTNASQSKLPAAERTMLFAAYRREKYACIWSRVNAPTLSRVPSTELPSGCVA